MDCWNCCADIPLGEFEIDDWGLRLLCEGCVKTLQTRGHQVEAVDPEDDGE